MKKCEKTRFVLSSVVVGFSLAAEKKKKIGCFGVSSLVRSRYF